MSRWRNTSSYSRSETDRTPNEWTAELGEHRGRIVVHTLHHCPGKWFVSAYPSGPQSRQLTAGTPEEAQTEAIDLVARYFDAMAAAARAVTG